ncbi:MAG: site-2 protease family protein [Candidatus Shapirobacteria bacterium]|nr:site-2 protease family protein [Candidatus Shapirobacteria bacterium]
MLTYLFSSPLYFLIYVVAILTAITIHEFAHAWAANRLGDPTARLAGRISLNPLVHLDPLGTLALLIFRFGWGKPVPFDPYNLKNPRRDSALISFAGPAANFILAIFLAIVIRLGHVFFGPNVYMLEVILTPFVFLALTLAVFNLLPFHPLDGGKIIVGLLPEKLAYQWDEILQRFGFYLVLFLILPLFGGYSLVSLTIFPIIRGLLNLLLPGTPLI